MRVWLLGSGSSGNTAVVESAEGRVLLDAGLGPRVSAEAMRALGGDLFGTSGPPVAGIVVTHHHNDHMARLEPLARALRVPVYLHSGVAAPRVRARYDVRPYPRHGTFTVGPFRVRSVPVPHDAPQVALSVAAHGLCFGIATDLGRATPPLQSLLADCDEALIEANYCPELLASGPYIERLKARVAGDLGHLSNEQTGRLAASLERTRLSCVWLGHISRVNNSPARALAAVRALARRMRVEVLPQGSPRLLEVRRGRLSMTQLGFEFGR